jgi:hypothetical protein
MYGFQRSSIAVLHGSQMPGCNTTSFLLGGNILIDAGTITMLLSVEERFNISILHDGQIVSF